MRSIIVSHITPSTCVPYEGDLPEWSKYKDSDECVMISDVIEEIYEELTRIREAIDVRDLGESCVKVSGDKTVAKFFMLLRIRFAMDDKPMEKNRHWLIIRCIEY